MNKLLYSLIGVLLIVIIFESVYLFNKGNFSQNFEANKNTNTPITKNTYKQVPLPEAQILADYYQNTLALKLENILTKSILEREYVTTVVETGVINNDPLNVAFLSYPTKNGVKRFEFSQHDIDIMSVSKGGGKISFKDLTKGDKIQMFIKNDPYAPPTTGTEILTITVLSN